MTRWTSDGADMATGTFIIAAASAALCSTIPDGDQRSYCQAREHQNVAFCASIMNADLRQACRAELMRDPSICDTLFDPSARVICKSRAGGGSTDLMSDPNG
jgi:hypothetical protein